MKKQSFIYACLLAMMLFSCGKATIMPKDAAALNIMNAVVGSELLATNFKGGTPYDYYRTMYVQYADPSLPTRHYSSYNGEQPLWIYNFPDTTEKDLPLLKLNLQLPAGSIHSLYVTGTLAQPDTMFVEEHLPNHSLGDSTTSIRFINLSPGSQSVKVTIQGKSSPEAGNIAYKTMSNFITYPVNVPQADDVFEFRDAASDAVIATFTATGIHYTGPSVQPHPWLFKNKALALIGIRGGTGAQRQQVVVINY
ncbi:hypothetical protein CLV59_108296 [Chitinophaga dinghuensis]|uniref:DUF4397 domain-containing protein n=1 Tax=Chitinophaga dinghuensis TaxID=1539050 RepID=A0A327VN54_9BACT|nr:DUF4397 domain-containing protein [Chitinophaga dinghuensis]RAJ76775.1 hypothetical protein CLV59_108296 [Chitinophaga dinghuensis]